MTPILPVEATLEVTEGPLAGSVYPIHEGQLSIGREPGNDIVLLDGGVSRRHCVIERRGEEFRLEDLGSRNASLVNDIRVGNHALSDGDRIRIGKSLLVFRLHRASLADTLAETAIDLGRSSVILRAEDVRFLKSGAPLPATERTVGDMNALLKISKAIHMARSAGALYQQILQSVLEVAGASRAAILLGAGPDEFDSIICLDRKRGQVEDPDLSRTVIGHVVRQRVAVLTNDIDAEESLQAAESLIMRSVRSVLAAPMEAFQRLLGVLYLESTDPKVQFDENLLELMTAVAGIGALALENANRMDSLEGENRRLAEEIAVNHDMVGEGAAIKQVIESIGRAARSEATVLISGESGTGKELVARAVHRNSDRANKPFIAINCAAIPENLLESELFGHEKGAFTGAVAQKKGKFELAYGGTVFLDEIGEMAPLLQGKLLRVLQEREMERVGGTRPIELDIRLIAATNRDLREESKSSRFRADLYYRLNVVSIRMPALRDRREDIPLLANYFAERYAANVKRRIRGISKRAMSLLVRYDWPGNVRELENAIERAVVMGVSDQILPEDLPETVLEQPAPSSEDGGGRLYEALREAKRQIVEKALAEAGGSQTQAAALLGVHPNHLSRLMRTLDMKKARGKGG
ncbi:MAG: sigma 54-interacting transcriptional regulator [Bryobacteraceae bacterium]|nr:sigma 54-interacting transcriptional regulator [Bryobacteraceae bacterium]